MGLLDLSQTAEMPRVHPRLLTSADICGQDIFMWVTEARRKTFNRLSPSCFRKGPTCAQRGYSGSTDWMRKTLTLRIGMTWMTVVSVVSIKNSKIDPDLSWRISGCLELPPDTCHLGTTTTKLTNQSRWRHISARC